ncbi:MAG: DUF2173 family protein [Betaproteobacteria bacterium]|nr:DUF2173 family protein [Betaproteobacteria bacterium]
MNLERLMKVPGALAAFQYTDVGDLTDHAIKPGTEFTPKVLDLLAHTCVANMAIATMEARGWEALTGQDGFEPLQAFALVGLDWSAVAGRHQAVIVDNSQLDYEAAFAALEPVQP